MEKLVSIGNELTLVRQLSDGDLSLPRTIKATLRSPNADVIDTITLSHIGQGLFSNNTFQMPELDFVTAQYFVFDEQGNDIDYTYKAGLDVFRNSEFIGLGGGSSRTVDEIVAELEPIDKEFVVEIDNDSD